MPPPTLFYDWMQTSTYTVAIVAGLLITLAATAYWLRRVHHVPIGHTVDVILIAIALGLIGARAAHVLVQWSYFEGNRAEITRIAAGGLNWQGAVVGAWIGLLIGSWLRKIPWMCLAAVAAVSLPFLALMAWWGSGAIHHAYGAPVDNLSYYPRWLVWEEYDLARALLPRYRVQPWGMAWSAAILLWMLVMSWRGWWPRRRFGLSLALIALGMVTLGYFRGDPVSYWGDLRADQWLDGLMFALGLAWMARPPIKNAGDPEDPGA